MIRPTIRQLSYLIAIQDEKSFSAAADLCLVTQSTLSAGIKELENILGQPLVNRGARKATLTPFGQETCETARRILNETDALMTRAARLKKPLSGPFRLGVIPTIAPYLLPVILPEIQKDFPDLELQIFEDLSARLLEKALQGTLDAILMAFPYETPGLEQNTLFEEPFLLAAPRKKIDKNIVSLEDLEKTNLLLLEDGHCLRDHALSACKLPPPRTRKTFSATSLPTLIQMVEHGYGATLLPKMAAKDSLLTENTRLIPFASPAPSRKIGLAWPENSPREADTRLLNKKLSTFLASLRDSGL